MSPIRRFDHVSITVADLDTVTGVFVGLGFETEGPDGLGGGGSWTRPLACPTLVPRSSCCEPDGGTGLELAGFIRPNHEPGSPDAMANEVGSAAWRSKWTTFRGLPRPSKGEISTHSSRRPAPEGPVAL